MKFLTAQWNNLLLANYSVNPEILEPYVPKGTSIELYEGHAFLSLVAFMFNRTHVFRTPIPGHNEFEEVNLRFYVKPDYDPSIRGVTFIKEIVPRLAIPIVANALFFENYECLQMNHLISPPSVSYSWTGARQHTFSARIEEPLSYPAPGSIAEFITEHYWGYSQARKSTLEYKVEHPQWKCSSVSSYEIEVDFEETYGKKFTFLNQKTPHNVQYALGSDVSVSAPKKIQPA